MGSALILAAAGSGTRFGGGPPKQFRPLAGRPVMLWALAAFTGLVETMVVVCDPVHRGLVQALLAAEDLPAQVVAGGSTRQQSVAAGLAALPASCDRVLVHDAARPLVPPDCIQACLRALDNAVGAVVAVPCAATVKQVADGMVEATRPRAGLWLAQTPQGLRLPEARLAFAQAAAQGWNCTDDVEVLERCGHRVAVVPGHAANLKITTPDDWILAEALLLHRHGAGHHPDDH